MVTFVCRFLNTKYPELASIHDMVDHIIYIANLIEREHVGVGTDFSGTPGAPMGLEVLSNYFPKRLLTIANSLVFRTSPNIPI
jgi:membrane dipeptidase